MKSESFTYFCIVGHFENERLLAVSVFHAVSTLLRVIHQHGFGCYLEVLPRLHVNHFNFKSFQSLEEFKGNVFNVKESCYRGCRLSKLHAFGKGKESKNCVSWSRQVGTGNFLKYFHVIKIRIEIRKLIRNFSFASFKANILAIVKYFHF